MKVIVPIPTRDFDPSEVAIPWKILHEAGVAVEFATDSGQVGAADQRMLDGHGLGLMKPLLIAARPARAAYGALRRDNAFAKPMRYEDIDPAAYNGLILPGGHAKGVTAYLESPILHGVIAGFFAAHKPVGAICHGVVAACRARDAASGRSVLYGRKTTALLESQEVAAWRLTRHRLGDYYRTYPQTVEAEVTAALRTPEDFIHGPKPIFRDSPRHLSRGFTVRDGHYLSARWPGDVHKFAFDFLALLREPT